MTTAVAAVLAVVFLWLGHVVAISFIEAPLRFRAPDVTVRIGIGIGRVVFRALNTVESVLALILVVIFVAGAAGTDAVIPIVIAVVVLAAQLVLVRPRLTRRTTRAMAGEQLPRSRAHLVYVLFEIVKAAALLTGGLLLISGA
ncbi:hypothetical protein [Lentzea sp.]|uniref:hypothetical protein n=1 Tax=Lentzea sp. TaxID=56099 RepID=UPI002C8C98BE|nr:hypothetical protein [Lentzea sp.]HUQ55577.1 hypothetical protein [Lentzea sp.]